MTKDKITDSLRLDYLEVFPYCVFHSARGFYNNSGGGPFEGSLRDTLDVGILATANGTLSDLESQMGNDGALNHTFNEAQLRAFATALGFDGAAMRCYFLQRGDRENWRLSP